MYRLSFLLLLIVFFTSCSSDIVYADLRSFDGKWEEEPVKFSFNILDTISKHNIFFIMRNNQNYVFSNLFLISRLETPKGEVKIDTLEYEMTKPSGEFLGKGFGVKENKLWYKKNIVFVNSELPYKISVSHAMRKGTDPKELKVLNGIQSFGISIEKSNK